MAVWLRFFLPLLFAIITTSSGMAWKTTEELKTLKSSPYCTTAPPKGINPDFYRWSKSNIDAYHGNPGRYFKKKMFYCHGVGPETEKIIYVWPTWAYYTREDWNYPLQVVDTKLGVLAVRGGAALSANLLLNNKEFMRHVFKINQTYAEKQGKPGIVLVTADWPDNFPGAYDILPSYIIDTGVTPPFVSNTPLVIGGAEPGKPQEDDKNYDERLPYAKNIMIEKTDADTYIFSGWAYALDDSNKNKDGKPLHIRYKYDRKTRTVTKM